MAWIERIGLVLVLVGCGAAEDPVAAERAPTSGDEVTREVPTGPVLSYLEESHRVVLRLDMERVRESTLSSDIGSLVRSYPTWRELLRGSGLDPVRDFDRVLVVAVGALNEGGRMLVRHHLTNERIREAVLAMAVRGGTRPEWRTVDGFDVVDWPADTEVPRIVVLSGEGELVVTTVEDLDAVLAVAHDHRLRRVDDELIEPALQLEDGVIATMVAAELSARVRARIRHPPDSIEVSLGDDLEHPGRLIIALRGNYADAASAETARTWVIEQRDFYAGQMLVRAVGLDRPLREAVIATVGAQLQVDVSFTEEEAQRVMGLLALAQIGG